MSAIYLLLLKITKTNVQKRFYYGNNLPKALLSGLKICLHAGERPNCTGSALLGGDCCCLTIFSLKVCKNKILQNVYDAVINLTVVKTTPTARPGN